tara:strand:+ start:334 stop:720 length:387 start_codon:yes stop_codon:yes gene_type:complete
MHFSVIFNSTCDIDVNSESYIKCRNDFVENLRAFGVNLRAEKKGDVMQGGLVLDHIQNAHLAEIELYTKDEEPTIHHASKFVKSTKSEKQIRNKISALYPKAIPTKALKFASDKSEKHMPSRLKGIQY